MKGEVSWFLQVVAVHDCSSIYRVPLLLQEQGVLEFFLKRLEIQVVQTRPSYLHKWRNLAERSVQWNPSEMGTPFFPSCMHFHDVGTPLIWTLTPFISPRSHILYTACLAVCLSLHHPSYFYL